MFTRESYSDDSALIFIKAKNADELKEICEVCESQGDWCFAWIANDIVGSFAEDISPALVDFVTSDFSNQELELRMHRLVRLDKFNVPNELNGISNEIAGDLTKKQLMILITLSEAGEQGLTKEEISQKIWKKENNLVAKESGFNVHMLHLRRRLESFGLNVSYDKRSRTYRLISISKIRNSIGSKQIQ